LVYQINLKINTMQEKIKSEGKCLFCGKTFAKAGINRHLVTHFKEKVEKGKPGKSFFVKIETDKSWRTRPYFLCLWIDGEAKMKELDTFLRGIWFECCGDQSAFRDRKKTFKWDYFEVMELMAKGKTKEFEKLIENGAGEVPIRRKAKEVLYNGLVLDYEYDFENSTKLSITVLGSYPVKVDEKIVLLSRNEPLKIMCASCGKAPATQICNVFLCSVDAECCDKCAKKHAKECEDFGDYYYSMPVVNSPRMGVFGYEGGKIDKDRDGVYSSDLFKEIEKY